MPVEIGKLCSSLCPVWDHVLGKCSWDVQNFRVIIMVRHGIQAMVAAKGKITSLQEQLDTTTGFLQQEREATQRALNLFSSSLLVRS